MPGKLFVNYRRGDDPGFTQALYLRLETEFSSGDVFMDVEGQIKPGDDFVEVINAQVAAADVVLVVIGPRWTKLLAARTKAGVGEAGIDYVVAEIEAALGQKKRVIPVLVGGATMPRADQLPGSIQALVRRNAEGLRPDRFKADCQRLVTELREYLVALKSARLGSSDPAQVAADAERIAGQAEQAATRAELKRTGYDWHGMKRWQVAAIIITIIMGVGAWGFEHFWRAHESSVEEVPEDAAPQAATLKHDPATVPERPAQRPFRPRDTFKDCDGCPDMVVIPAGEFMMGSDEDDNEKPRHRVTIRQPFAVGKFAVTFDEWDACAAAGGCDGTRPGDEGWGRGKRPLIYVSWNDATRYIAWLSARTGQTYRLPSEAEWEYAARAGSATKYRWGDDVGTGHANCSECGSQWDDKQTAPVGSFPPNAWGLYDMNGNVWQWVEDPYHDTYNGAPAAGSVWAAGGSSSRVVRGGSWHGDADFLRSAYRNSNPPDSRYGTYGFRVARTLLAASP